MAKHANRTRFFMGRFIQQTDNWQTGHKMGCLRRLPASRDCGCDHPDWLRLYFSSNWRRTESRDGRQLGHGDGKPTSQREQWLAMFARGYFPGRSGQVFVVPKEGDIITYERSALSLHARVAVGLRHAHPDPLSWRAVREDRRLQRRRETAGHCPNGRRHRRRAGTGHLHRTRAHRGDRRRRRQAACRVGDRARRDARRLLREACGRDAHAHAPAPRRRVVHRGATDRAADGHRRRSRQHRHRQRSAHSRHHRQQPVQSRDRKNAGGVRPARYARAHGADACGLVEPRHRRQGGDHRPGRRAFAPPPAWSGAAPASSARAR